MEARGEGGGVWDSVEGCAFRGIKEGGGVSRPRWEDGRRAKNGAKGGRGGETRLTLFLLLADGEDCPEVMESSPGCPGPQDPLAFGAQDSTGQKTRYRDLGRRDSRALSARPCLLPMDGRPWAGMNLCRESQLSLLPSNHRRSPVLSVVPHIGLDSRPECVSCEVCPWASTPSGKTVKEGRNDGGVCIPSLALVPLLCFVLSDSLALSILNSLAPQTETTRRRWESFPSVLAPFGSGPSLGLLLPSSSHE